MRATRRIRAHAGSFLLLAVLTLTAAVAVTVVPRLTRAMTTDGLRQYVADQPAGARQLVLQQAGFRGFNAGPTDLPFDDPEAMRRRGPSRLPELRAAMPAQLERLVDGNWYHHGLPDASVTGADARFSLVAIDGVAQAADLVDGAWPAATAPPLGVTEDPSAPHFSRPAEIALSAAVAEALGLRVGSELLVSANGDVPVIVVGIFTPHDADDGIWQIWGNPLELTRIDDRPSLAGAVTSEAVIESLGRGSVREWRYRLAVERLDAAELDALINGIEQLRRQTAGELDLTQGVDLSLRQFAESHRAAGNLLAIIAAGVVAALAGLVGLAAAFAARRRQAEYALLRARGASRWNLLRRSLAETALVVAPTALLGAGIGLLLPGLPAGNPAPVAVLAVVLMLLPALFVLLAPATAGRGGLSRLAGSTARLAAETALLLVTGMATYLLLARGLDTGAGVDPLLAAVPVLLAAAAALLVLRLYPLPMRLAGAVAARRRGAVAFLGLARAGRAPVTAPLVVVVVAVATSIFCAALATGITEGRAHAARQQVPADILITGGRYAPDTADRLADLPGITGVAPLISLTDQRVYADGVHAELGTIDVLILDVDAYARVSGGVDDLPGVLREPRHEGRPVPALASASLAADLAGATAAEVALPVARQPIEVVGALAEFPLLDQAEGRFLVLPWAAAASGTRVPMVPTGFLLSGAVADPAALARAGDEGQQRFLDSQQIPDGGLTSPTQVTTRAQVDTRLAATGVNALVQFAFVAGAVGGALLALIAVAFAVLAGHRQRGELLSRLRTMGLSRGQARGLLTIEIAPLVVTAVLAGAVVGALLPRLLGPVLALRAVTGGVPVPVDPRPALLAGVAALAVAGLLLAWLVESVNNRRTRLGQALRLGEES